MKTIFIHGSSEQLLQLRELLFRAPFISKAPSGRRGGVTIDMTLKIAARTKVEKSAIQV